IASLLRKNPKNHYTEFYAKLRSRLSINLAESLIENAGIALDRNFGFPYIPASAIKGCCAHAAYWLVEEGSLDNSLVRSLFGFSEKDNTQAKGWVQFLPATPVESVRITQDILTPHPTDSQGNEKDPIPNKFPVVQEGAIFRFSYWVHLPLNPNPEIQIPQIQEALTLIFERAFEEGIGAKTAAGLGWFIRDREYEAKIGEQHKAEEERRMEEAEKKQKELELQRKAAEEARRR
ncbi:MAG: type III-B CRISPR module RAMP protein Cmr6, partial [Puniceicoccales bacterium]